MNETKDLCRMLDELRKLACAMNEKEIKSHSVITLNQGRYNRQFRLDLNHEWLDAWHAEFERILQAVETTLEQGTCEMEYVSDFMSWHCKACDHLDMAPRNPKPRYCKCCGRKVVEE